jgi:hypothetical protein
MKKFHFARLALVSSVIALGISGCAKDQQSTVKSIPTPVVDPDGSSTDDWQSIKTLAQSIEDVRVDYDTVLKTASLYFQFRNLDVLDEHGVPEFTYVESLKGQLGADRTASLSDPQVQDISAKLKCADDKCLVSEVVITKVGGKLAGSAKVTTKTVENVGQAVGVDGDITQVNTETEAAKALQSNDPRTVSLTVRQVVDGRKNFFSIKTNFSNILHRQGDPDYFVAKSTEISGVIGQNQLLHIGYAVSSETIGTGDISPFYGDVTYAADRDDVVVTFKKDEGLTVVNAGRILFPPQHGR